MKSNCFSPRALWCTLVFLASLCLYTPSAFSQSGTLYGPYIIPVNSCGPTSYSDFRNNAGYANNVGYPSPEICYSFTLSQATNVDVSLCGSNFDTYLQILDQNGTVLYSNDDDGLLCGEGTKSSLSKVLQAGTYIIAAEGYSSYTGNIALDVQIQGGGAIVPGSGMAGAINMGTFIGSGTFSDARSNANACLGNNYGQLSNDIFYRFELTGSSSVELMHCGSGFDTYMYLLDQWGSEITHSDDNTDSPICPGNQSYIQRTLPAGIYYVVSEGYGGYTGTINTTIKVGVSGSPGAPVISYSSPKSVQAGTAISLSPTNTGGAVSAAVTAVTLAPGSGNFSTPLGTAVDGQGNVYVADGDNHRIRKISWSGAVSTFAGSGSPGYADGAGTYAQFQHPSALVVDASGNVYVSDQQNHRIRKISPSGNVTTVAGAGYAGYSDGNGTSAVFSSPIGLALDASGNLYVADYGNNRIRKITPAGAVSTYAGNGSAGMVNSSNFSSSFRNPMGLSFDDAGNLYVADRLNHAIRKITPSGTVSTVAGSGSVGYGNGVGTGASFNYPNGVASDAGGNLYVADQQNNRIRKVSTTGLVSTLAGTGSAATTDGTGAAISFNSPYGLSIDAMGTLYIAESSGNAVRKVSIGGYTISPSLPAGMDIDPVTGIISGTPASASPMTVYTVTANGTSGKGTATLSLEVTAGVTCIAASPDQNYIISYVPRVEAMMNVSAVIAASCNKDLVQTDISYFDGLGRPSQSVQVKASPLGKDIIKPVSYDGFGREERRYLSYATESNSGGFRTNALQPGTGLYGFYNPAGGTGQSGEQLANGLVRIPTPFSQSVYEVSPLNRMSEQGAPGNDWQPVAGSTSGHTVKIVYGTNGVNDVYLWKVSSTGSGAGHGQLYYPTGKLYRTTTMDENWVSGNAGKTEEFKDLEGRVVLRRVWKSEAEKLDTYYIYNDFGNLAYVLPPAVTAASFTEQDTDPVFGNFIYAYHYDGKKRVVEKKIPGKGWDFMVYNKLDQLVASQDALQRAKAPQDFSISKYDALGRVVMTGIYTYPSSVANTSYRAALQTTLNAQTILWEDRTTTGTGYSNLSWPTSGVSTTLSLNYYDNYVVPGLPAAAPYNLSASYNANTKSLPTVGLINILGTAQMLWRVNYYDADWRLARLVTQHYKGGAITVNNYDDVSYSYSFTGEVTSTTRRHYINGTESLYATNRITYDHTGRPKDTYQKTGDNISTANPEVLLSRKNYNEIGQLMSKQLHSINTGTSFVQTVSYQYNPRGWLKNQTAPLFSQFLKYEDVIAGVAPQYNGNISRQEWGSGKFYNYAYDKLNRLSLAVSSDNYNEKSIQYDVMGNIKGLQRSAGSTAFVDQLKYDYTGNRLSSVLDSNANTLDKYQLPQATVYAYDVNGNLISRTNATNASNNLTAISYNLLNLPKSLTAGGNTISYTYDAMGNKLKKLVSGTANVNNEYISGIQYEGGVLKYMQTSEGRVVRNSATDYSYEYTLTDHLGNGRLYFDISGGVARKIQEVDYFAFGLDIQRMVSGAENKFQYNGKEKQDQEKMYDYGARLYDPVIGRFNTIDLLAEVSRKNTPYGYALNNPLRFIDVDGMYAGEAGNYKQGDLEFEDVLAYYGVNKNEDQDAENHEPDKNITELFENQRFNSVSLEGRSDTEEGEDDGRGKKKKGKDKDKLRGGSQKDRDQSIKRYPLAFQRWYHKNIKPTAHPGRDATPEELEEGYEDWEQQGRPDAMVKTALTGSNIKPVAQKVAAGVVIGGVVAIIIEYWWVPLLIL